VGAKRWLAGLFHWSFLADNLKLGRDDGCFAHLAWDQPLYWLGLVPSMEWIYQLLGHFEGNGWASAFVAWLSLL
jgi:hypothetical protein